MEKSQFTKEMRGMLFIHLFKDGGLRHRAKSPMQRINTRILNLVGKGGANRRKKDRRMDHLGHSGGAMGVNEKRGKKECRDGLGQVGGVVVIPNQKDVYGRVVVISNCLR